jgi:hypothetical protein
MRKMEWEGGTYQRPGRLVGWWRHEKGWTERAGGWKEGV